MNKKNYAFRINRIFWAVILFMGITSGNAFSQWTIYDASVVPLENVAPAFTRSNVSVTNEVFDSWSTIIVDPDDVDNNLMQFLDDAAGQRGMWRSNLPSGTSKLTFVAKIKAYDYENLDWTLDIDFDFGGTREQFFIMNSDKIRVRRGTDTTHDLPIDFDLTNWNTFRFVFDNEADPKTVKVYLNEAATPFIEATPANAGTNNFFRFGNGDNNRTVGYLMDWIIWDTSGAYAPGEGAAIPSPVVTPSWNADLAELKVDGADIDNFSADVLSYEVVLPVGTTDVPVVTAVASDTEATVLITPATEIPGTSTILVTAENGITAKTYSVSYRIVSDVATLQQIAVDGEAISDFNPEVLVYNVNLPLETKDVPVVTAVATGPGADVVLTQATELPGQTTIVVTAEDGIAELTYTVNFVLVSTDATLADILANGTTIPGFDSEVTEYNVFYPVGTTDVPVITATSTNESATLVITQATEFPGIATIVVTAEDGETELTYTVNLLTGSSDATLADLQVGGVTIEGFDKDVLEYFLVNPVGTTDVPVITAATTDENANILITEATEIPGVTTIVVTAEDNFTVLTYTVNIRNISDNADLSDLLVNGTTVEGFDPDVLSYDVELSPGTVDIPVVTAVAASEYATEAIDPATELPGTATVVVTAEDDETKKTYVINFTVKEGPLTWRVYDARVLPTENVPVFEESNVVGPGATNVLVTDPDDSGNSFLELITPTVGDNFMWRSQLQPETPGLTMVMKVKAANNVARRVVELDIHHNGIRERLYINREANRVRLNEAIGGGDGGEIEAPAGVSLSDWNIYRITKSEGEIKLYLNEDPTPIAQGTAATATTQQYFRFGDGNGSHDAAALLDWIIWDETGAYAPGEGSAIPTNVVTPNWDATISELLVDGTLIEGFDPETTEYDIVLADGTTDIPVIAATVNYPDAQMVVTQATELPGVATVMVTAVNGFTIYTYNVTLRFISSNADLAEINIGATPLADFDPEVLDYDVVLPAGTTVAPEVSAVAAHHNATVEITQAAVLPGEATIKVTAEDGTTVETYTINFTISTSVSGLNEIGFRMYPNPATSQLNLEWSQSVQGRIVQVINVNGQVVIHRQVSSSHEILDISFLEQGVYILQIVSEQEQARQLFIKR